MAETIINRRNSWLDTEERHGINENTYIIHERMDPVNAMYSCSNYIVHGNAKHVILILAVGNSAQNHDAMIRMAQF